MFLNLRGGSRINQRSDLGVFFQTIAHFHGSDLFRKFCGKCVVDSVLHQDAVCTDTGLTRVAELCHHQAFDCRVEIGIVKYDHRGIAAELHRALFDRFGRLPQQHLANLGRAGERHLAD